LADQKWYSFCSFKKGYILNIDTLVVMPNI